MIPPVIEVPGRKRLDGDAPHTSRGCDAQAWSATEALRVWRLLNPPTA